MKSLFDWLRAKLEYIFREHLYVVVIVVLAIGVVHYGWKFFNFYANSEEVTSTRYTLNEQAKRNVYRASELLLNSEQLNNEWLDSEQLTTELGLNKGNNENNTEDKKEINSKNESKYKVDGTSSQRANTQLDMDLFSLIENLPALLDEDKGYQHPTLIIRRLGSNVTENNAQALLDWVKQGGHLIAFPQRSAEVSSEDWQVVAKRLQVIKNNLNTKQGLKQNTKQSTKQSQSYDSAYAEAIAEDEQLQQALTEIADDNDDVFWQKLGVYLLERDYHNLKYTEPKGANPNNNGINGNNSADNDSANNDEINLIDKLNDTLNKELDSLKTLGDSRLLDKKREDNKASTLDESNIQIRRYIKDFIDRYSNTKRIITVQQGNDSKQLMIENNKNNYLNADLLFATNPEVKVRTQFRLADANQIRHYLKQQLAIINHYLSKVNKKGDDRLQDKRLEKANKKSNFFYFTPQEQQKALESLLKLSDKTLLSLFADIEATRLDKTEVNEETGFNKTSFDQNKLNKIMLDVDYGQGRITVLKSADIWLNPSANEVKSIEERQQFLQQGILPVNRFGKITAPVLDIFDNDSYASLYHQEHAELLTDLTADSEQIWLFPNIDIDSLLVMLWKNARLAILGLVFLTLIWLWSLYNRFGKRQYLLNSHSADIFYYFRQIGRYGWDYDRGRQLSKSSRQQVLQSVNKALGLKVNAPLNQQYIAQLSQLLQQRLANKLSSGLSDKLSDKLSNDLSNQSLDKLDKLTIDSKTNDELLMNMRANRDELSEYLSSSQLAMVLLPSSQDLENMNARDFVQYTQTLWLVKWLLG